MTTAATDDIETSLGKTLIELGMTKKTFLYIAQSFFHSFYAKARFVYFMGSGTCVKITHAKIHGDSFCGRFYLYHEDNVPICEVKFITDAQSLNVYYLKPNENIGPETFKLSVEIRSLMQIVWNSHMDEFIDRAMIGCLTTKLTECVNNTVPASPTMLFSKDALENAPQMLNVVGCKVKATDICLLEVQHEGGISPLYIPEKHVKEFISDVEGCFLSYRTPHDYGPIIDKTSIH